MSGIERIAAERRRQIEAEGWSPEHDDGWLCGEIAAAAAVYALPPSVRAELPCAEPEYGGDGTPDLWPWHHGDYKPAPEDRVRELVKAGALIAAEIDRLERVAAGSGKETP